MTQCQNSVTQMNVEVIEVVEDTQLVFSENKFQDENA